MAMLWLMVVVIVRVRVRVGIRVRVRARVGVSVSVSVGVSVSVSVSVNDPGHACTDLHGWTPLHWCSRMGFEDVAPTLLKAGANPDAIAGCGATPLMMATVKLSSRKTAEYLMSYGANLGASG
jgi:hypothetical protein